MPRTFGSGAQLSIASALESVYPLADALWVNLTSITQDARFICLTKSGDDTTRVSLGTKASAANGGVQPQVLAAGVGGGPITAAMTANTWVLVGMSATAGTLTGTLSGVTKATGSGAAFPTGINKTNIGGREGDALHNIPGQAAHAMFFSRVLADAEWGYLQAFGNPRNLPNLDHFYDINSTGTENDLIGSSNLTVTGTTAGTSDPNIASFFTGSAIPNQSWTQGSAIASIDLTTKFYNALASSAPWTGTLKQLGSAGTATHASGGGTASNLLTVASVTGISAGNWVQVGSNALVWILSISGSTLVLSSTLTWNDLDTVTPYPVNTVTAITSNGVTVNGSNVCTGTPGAGAVGSFSNCLFQNTNNVNSGAISYSNLFNIAIASSAATPSFSAGPTYTSTQTDGYTFGATSNQTASWWQGVYVKGSPTPTATNLINGTGTGFVSHFSTALTLNVAGSNTSTALTNPVYDVYHCLTNVNGNSAVVSFTNQLKAPPAGKQYVQAVQKTISAITKANPCQVTITAHGYSTGNWLELFGIGGMTQLNGFFGTVTVVDANNVTLDNTDSTGFTTYTSGGIATWGQSAYNGASTVVATGDVGVFDAVTTPGNYPLTFTAEGVPAYAANGDTTRQQFAADAYSVSGNALIGVKTQYVNNHPPSLPPDLQAIFLTLNQAANVNLSTEATSPQGDDLTVTASGSLPAGLTLTGGAGVSILGGSPTARGIVPTGLIWTDKAGESSTLQQVIVVGNIDIPNVVGMTSAAATQALANVYLGWTVPLGSAPDPNPAGPSPAGTVIVQSPTGQAPPNTLITLVLSDGTAPVVGPVNPVSVIVKSNVVQNPPTLVLDAGNTFEQIAYVPRGAIDASGSSYRFFPLPSSAIVLDLLLKNDVAGVQSVYQCGVLAVDGKLPIAGAESIFSANVDLSVSRPFWTPIFQPHLNGQPVSLTAIGLPLWKLLGLAADPNTLYEVGLTAVSPGNSSGYVAAYIKFITNPASASSVVKTQGQFV